MTPTYKEYMTHKAEMKKSNEESRKRNNQIVNDKIIRLSTTTSNTITNMTDAYSQVRNSGHRPTKEEIDYLRFSSGSYVDMEPEN